MVDNEDIRRGVHGLILDSGVKVISLVKWVSGRCVCVCFMFSLIDHCTGAAERACCVFALILLMRLTDA